MAGRNAAGSPENLGALSPEEIRKLVNELRVHQVELEMQNEELRLTLGKLDASQARYFDFYDLAPVGYFTLGDAGLILQANLTAAALLGVARDELLKQSITRFIFSEDQDTYYLLRKQIVATGAPQACELRLLKQDGTHFWARLDAIAAADENHVPVLRIVLSDVTERKQSASALQASEQKYRALLEHAADAVLISDMAGTLLEINAAAETLLGYERNELIGEHIRMIHPAEEMPWVAAAFAKFSDADRVDTGDCHVLTKQGQYVPVQVNAMAIMVGERKVAMGIFRDLSVQKKLEAQRLRNEAAHRDALVREVHHRIKNSLQGVTGILRGLAQRQPALAAALDDVVGQVGSIALVHGLYGSAPDRRVSLCDLVADVARNAESLWQMEIAVAAEHNCPHCILDEREAVPLALVLNELLANACKHGAAAGTSEKRTIAVEYAADYSQARVRITNPGHLPPGFDFGKRQGLGTGLGLVAVLLPRESASLDWTQQQDTVVTLLSLSAPIFAEQTIAEGSSA